MMTTSSPPRSCWERAGLAQLLEALWEEPGPEDAFQAVFTEFSPGVPRSSIPGMDVFGQREGQRSQWGMDDPLQPDEECLT